MSHDLHSRFEKYALILGILYCVAVITWDAYKWFKGEIWL